MEIGFRSNDLDRKQQHFKVSHREEDCLLEAHGQLGGRTTTNRLVAEIKGMLVKEQEAPRTPVRVLVIDSNSRPPVNGKPKMLDVPPPSTPGLEPPKTTSSTPGLHWIQRDS